MKNPFGKSRPVGQGYVKLVDPRTGWEYEVLKLYKAPAASLSDPYARALCSVHGFEHDIGDCYVNDVWGLRQWLLKHLGEEVARIAIEKAASHA
jgi:hypothetical protein